MKVGIFVYSESKEKNTLGVSQKLSEAIGKSAEIFEIEVVGGRKEGQSYFNFVRLPDYNRYDVLIFASFVEAFSLNPVMKQFFNKSSSFSQKPVYLFVTQAFPFAWMGGNHAIKKMSDFVSEKEGKVEESFVINWMGNKKESQIEKLLSRWPEKMKSLG